jgi:hypothetical protein
MVPSMDGKVRRHNAGDVEELELNCDDSSLNCPGGATIPIAMVPSMGWYNVKDINA